MMINRTLTEYFDAELKDISTPIKEEFKSIRRYCFLEISDELFLHDYAEMHIYELAKNFRALNELYMVSGNWIHYHYEQTINSIKIISYIIK